MAKQKEGKYISTYPTIETSEMVGLINDALEYNATREEEKDRLTLHFQGHPGLGKTMIIQSTFFSVTWKISNLNEMGDALGFPIPSEKEDHHGTMRPTMLYAPPEFTLKFKKKDRGVLILDDMTRAPERIIQGMMSMTHSGTLEAWDIPKGWTVVLTTNPPDGEQHVIEFDTAQETRFESYWVRPDINFWASWARKNGVHESVVTFVQKNPDYMDARLTIHNKLNFRTATVLGKQLTHNPKFLANPDAWAFKFQAAIGERAAELVNMLTMPPIPSADELIEKGMKAWDEVKWKDKNGKAHVGAQFDADDLNVQHIVAGRLVHWFVKHKATKEFKENVRNSLDDVLMSLAKDVQYKFFVELLEESKSQSIFQMLIKLKTIEQYDKIDRLVRQAKAGVNIDA